MQWDRGQPEASRLAGCRHRTGVRDAGVHDAGVYRVARVLGALIVVLTAAGCGSFGPSTAPSAQARAGAIAFESVDGPPPEVFNKLVRDLNEEAAARQIVVVPRGGDAYYRIRGYLAAHVERGATSIAWAWDVYDAEQRRAFRLDGQERAGSGSRSAWAAADEQVLRRIARASMDQLAAFMASSRTPTGAEPVPAAPAAPGRNSGNVARIDDFRPEAAGIVRVKRASEPAATVTATADLSQPGPVPLPRRRPTPPGTPKGAALAYAVPGR